MYYIEVPGTLMYSEPGLVATPIMALCQWSMGAQNPLVDLAFGHDCGQCIMSCFARPVTLTVTMETGTAFITLDRHLGAQDCRNASKRLRLPAPCHDNFLLHVTCCHLQTPVHSCSTMHSCRQTAAPCPSRHGVALLEPPRPPLAPPLCRLPLLLPLRPPRPLPPPPLPLRSANGGSTSSGPGCSIWLTGVVSSQWKPLMATARQKNAKCRTDSVEYQRVDCNLFT